MRYPGAVQKPIARNYTARPRHATRGVILHVAGGEAKSLQGWFNNPAAQASSHLYVTRTGVIEQYVDMRYSSWTSGTASYTTIGVETQGGASGPWTPQQVEALARICAWAHTTYGVPLQAMTSSAPNQRGIGWHRLGVPATRAQKAAGRSQTGGALWSKDVGKVCPGTERIAQIPSIIRRAQALVGNKSSTPATPTGGDELVVTKQELEQIAYAVWSYTNKAADKRDAYGILRGTPKDVWLYKNAKVTSKDAYSHLLAAGNSSALVKQIKSIVTAAVKDVPGVDAAALAQRIADEVVQITADDVADEVADKLTVTPKGA